MAVAMTEDGLHGLYQAIGSLTATVESLGRKIEDAEKRAAQNHEKAEDGRVRVHKRMDSLADDLGTVRTDVATMKDTVAESKKVTDDVKRWKLLGMGAIAMIGLGGTAFGAALFSIFGPLIRPFMK